MNEETTPQKTPGGKAAAFLLITFCFLLFGAICFFAGRVLWQQGREMEVSIDAPGEEFTSSVTFTVRNVLGMDILIDECKNSCAMLQFLRDGQWEDVCEIRFVREDSAVISVKYGGMYAHLEPGMTLTYCLDEALLDIMESGEYRIAIPYIGEEEYLHYLQKRGEEIDESLENAASENENASENVSEEELSDADGTVSEESQETEAPEIRIFYEEFVFVGRTDISAK